MSEPLDPSGWLDQYGDALFRYALLRVRDPAAAEDLVQDTLLAAIESSGRFNRKSTVKTWLTAILKHKIVDFLRHSSRERRFALETEAPGDLEGESFDRRGRWRVAIGDWSHPEKVLENMQFLRALDDCLAALPESMARLFILREVDGLSGAELCNVLGISTTNNAWVMLSRIRMRLRRCLETHWFEPMDGKGN